MMTRHRLTECRKKVKLSLTYTSEAGGIETMPGASTKKSPNKRGSEQQKDNTVVPPDQSDGVAVYPRHRQKPADDMTSAVYGADRLTVRVPLTLIPPCDPFGICLKK
eukprot:6829093-Pyramimonas_sp.AAC.2